jgi:hypothetical protein
MSAPRDPAELELAQRFALLRADDERGAPELAALLARARAKGCARAPRGRGAFLMAGAALGAALAALLWVRESRAPRGPAASVHPVAAEQHPVATRADSAAVGAQRARTRTARLLEIERDTWAAPSDFLLAPPERDLAHALPRLGYSAPPVAWPASAAPVPPSSRRPR